MKMQESGEMKSPARYNKTQRCSLVLQEGLGPVNPMYWRIPRAGTNFKLPPVEQRRLFLFPSLPAAAGGALLDAPTPGSSGNLWSMPEILSPTRSRKAGISSLSTVLKYLFMEPNKLKKLFLLEVNLKCRWKQGKCTWFWEQLQTDVNPN